MKISSRQKASLAIFGGVVAAGLALSGGLDSSVHAASSSAQQAASSASSAASDAASRAASSAATSAGAEVSRAASSAASSAASGAASSAASSAAAGAGAQAGSSLSNLLASLGASGASSAPWSSARPASSWGGVSPSAAAAPTSWGADPGRVVLVLDSSRSMSTIAPSGRSRMAEARQALAAVIASLPASAQVGLRVYGSQVDVVDPDRPSAAACRDSRPVVPIKATDRQALHDAVSAFSPHGYTPTSYALEQAAADLGGSGRRTIILVSDGEESCRADPAQTARRLRASGIDLTIDTVGLHTGTAASNQLRSIASAGGGTYSSASSSAGLQTSLQDLLARIASRGGSGTTSEVPVSAASFGTTSDPATGRNPGPLFALILVILAIAWLRKK